MIFDKIQKTLFKTKIEISLRPDHHNGLLLYSGKYAKDFLSVGLLNGHIVFQFDLGSGQAFIKSREKVTLGQWVNIEVGRDGSIGYLKLAASSTVFGKSSGRFTGLNLESELYLGGYSDYSEISKQIGHNVSFTGCISQLIINSKKMDCSKSIFQGLIVLCLCKRVIHALLA